MQSIERLRESRFRRDLAYVGFLLISVALFFKDALLGRRTLLWDAADQFYPYLYSISVAYRNGEIPLWNPFFFNGYPQFGNIQAQMFYPMNFLFYPLTAFTPYVVYLSLLLHLFLAGAFMYMLARYYVDNRQASALAGLVYMLSGFVIGHIEHLTILGVMAWFPLVFLFLEKSLRNADVSNALIAGFFLGISTLAGHPQSSHVIFSVLLIHSLYRAGSNYARTKKKIVFLKTALSVVICFVTALLIAAVQLIPTYELVKNSMRGGALTLEVIATGGQFSFSELITILLPNYFGTITGSYWGQTNVSQNVLYIGVTPLLLGGLALLGGIKKSENAYFFLMAIFPLLLSLGEHGLVFPLLYHAVPGFDHFRGPANTVFLYTFFAAILAAHGLDVLSDKLPQRKLHIYLILFFVVCAVLYALGPIPPGEDGGVALRHTRAGFGLFIVLFSLTVGIALLSYRYQRYQRAFYGALVILAFVDLYVSMSGSITIGSNASPTIFEEEPGIVSLIKKHSDIAVVPKRGPSTHLSEVEIRNGLFRIYTEPAGNQGTEVFGHQRAMLHRTFLVEGYDPVELIRHRRLGDTVNSRNYDNYMKINNVKYISWTHGKSYEVNIYPYFLPRVFIVPNARFIESDDQVLRELATFDPTSEVLISGKGGDVTGRVQNPNRWKTSVIRYANNDVEIETYSEYEGFLVLSDTYYPGWHATIDGIERPVLRANYDFRAILLPSGAHRVVFNFEPPSFKHGLIVSAFGILLLGLALSYIRYAKISKKQQIRKNGGT